MIVRLPKPADLNGTQFADELGIDPLAVSVAGDTVEVVTGQDEATVKAALDAHVPAAPPPDPDEEMRDRLANFPANGSPKDLAELLAGTDGGTRVPGRRP